MGIQGYVSLLLHDLRGQHHLHEKLKCIEEQIESGSTLTKQLLGFARVGSHEARPTNLNAFLAESKNVSPDKKGGAASFRLLSLSVDGKHLM